MSGIPSGGIPSGTTAEEAKPRREENLVATKKAGAEAGQTVKETREQEKAVEEAAAEERVPQAYYEVRVNPRLGLRSADRVSVGGLLFYANDVENRARGTWIVDDIQWEVVGEAKERTSGLKYIVKKTTVESEADEGGEG